MRAYETGATRDDDEGKLDFEAFFSHPVLVEYALYMHENRYQADGKMRAGDNWQKGMPKDDYMKSLFRHFMDAWGLHRGSPQVTTEEITEALCAVIFNSMGYLHEVLREREREEGREQGTTVGPASDGEDALGRGARNFKVDWYFDGRPPGCQRST